jgi:hypothetical protein
MAFTFLTSELPQAEARLGHSSQAAACAVRTSNLHQADSVATPNYPI